MALRKKSVRSPSQVEAIRTKERGLSSPILFKGQVSLSDTDSEWFGEITRFILRENEISFEFNGRDPELGPFSGSATLQHGEANRYAGAGQFRLIGSLPLTSTTNFRVRLDQSGKTGMAEGLWIEDGTTYILEISLQQVGVPPKGKDELPDFLIGPPPEIQLEQHRSAKPDPDHDQNIALTRASLKRVRDKERQKAKSEKRRQIAIRIDRSEAAKEAWQKGRRKGGK